MILDKEILYKAFWALALFILAYKFVPFILTSIKESLMGKMPDESDIDILVKREKEKLKSQYLIKGESLVINEQYIGESNTKNTPINNPKLQEIYKDLSWGDAALQKNTKDLITKNFGYTLSDSKVSSFFQLIKSKNYLQYLQSSNLEDKNRLANYLSCTLILHLLIEENKTGELDLAQKISKKCSLRTDVFNISFQLKILENLKLKTPLKDDKKYTSNLVLKQISQETLQTSIDRILQKESNLWASDINHFYEELAFFVKEAEIIAPLPSLKNKSDLETAFEILGCDTTTTDQEIKSTYKKLAMIYHPDKINAQIKSDYLRQVSSKKFNQIKEAYDIVNSKGR